MILPDVRQAKVLKGQRVLVRVDFNVPLGSGGVAAGGEWRLKAVVPTLKLLSEQGAQIIILSHLGRPRGRDLNFSLYPVFEKLKEFWPEGNLVFSPEILGAAVENSIKKLKNGQAILLENLRFYPEEEKNDQEFARQLSTLGDIFVNDGFAVSHRAHASLVGPPKFLNSYAGLLLQKEVTVLSAVREKPRRPLVFVLGGAKAETKLKLIWSFLEKSEAILLGGVLANTLLYARGMALGRSILEENLVSEMKELNLTSTKLHLPVDVVVSKSLEAPRQVETRAVGRVGQDEFVVDIGPDTVSIFNKVIKNARMIVWNGSLGLVEVPAFKKSSVDLLRLIVQSRAEKIVGGGDLVSFLYNENALDKMSYVSTGGGAMIEFLAGESLPGLAALEQ